MSNGSAEGARERESKNTIKNIATQTYVKSYTLSK